MTGTDRFGIDDDREASVFFRLKSDEAITLHVERPDRTASVRLDAAHDPVDPVSLLDD